MSPPLSEPVRALVVDDEAPARRRLIDLLRISGDIAEVLEAENGVIAVSQIETARPDIVFLDIQMPGVDGFGVIEALGVERMPLTVFVTAHDRFAVKAFEANAIDYLLKPFNDQRYEKTMKRVLSRLAQIRAGAAGPATALTPAVLELLAKRTTPGEYWRWIVVKSGGLTKFIMAEDIDWIEAVGVYVNLHAAGKEYLYRAALSAVLERLDPFRFVRIHRSRVVNIRSIVQLEKRSHGEFDVLLTDGTRLTLSRTYRAGFEKTLGQSL